MLVDGAGARAARIRAYEDIASKFFEHFVAIADAMNTLGGTGLWDEDDGFYYDQLHVDGRLMPLRVRSMVGLIPLFAVEIIEQDDDREAARVREADALVPREPAGARASTRRTWRADRRGREHAHRLLAIPSRERLERVLRYVLDETEFLSPHGVRSLSRVHADEPVRLPHRRRGVPRRLRCRASRTSGLFGGNSNWRGPVWFPVNYLLDRGAASATTTSTATRFTVECPTGSRPHA